MAVIIQAKPRVKDNELADLLKDLHSKSSLDFLIVSSWQEIHFVRFHANLPIIPVSDRGRAFGENSELRWRRDEENEHFICRWISDDGTCLPKSEGWERLNSEFQGEEIGYLLWGEPLFDGSGWMHENNEPIWYQARIPKKLKYPINNLAQEWKYPNDKTPLVLKVCEYRQNGQTMFERFIGLDRYR